MESGYRVPVAGYRGGNNGKPAARSLAFSILVLSNAGDARTNTNRCGGIWAGGAGFHTAVAQATPGLELAAVVQRSGDDAKKEYPEAHVARSVEEMLSDVGIQLVVIATPSYSHYEPAKQCLHEQRHVVIDKPFTLTSTRRNSDPMARQRKLLLTAYQNRRWDGDFQTIRQVIASGDLGRLVTVDPTSTAFVRTRGAMCGARAAVLRRPAVRSRTPSHRPGYGPLRIAGLHLCQRPRGARCRCGR